MLHVGLILTSYLQRCFVSKKKTQFRDFFKHLATGVEMETYCLRIKSMQLSLECMYYDI